jgi:hypothetical protein
VAFRAECPQRVASGRGAGFHARRVADGRTVGIVSVDLSKMNFDAKKMETATAQEKI